MIETALVYIHAVAPASRFVGCGALVEGGYIATCRHVWRMATGESNQARVEIIYPYAPGADGAARHGAVLAHLAGR
jgi:hypothetical protein